MAFPVVGNSQRALEVDGKTGAGVYLLAGEQQPVVFEFDHENPPVSVG